MTDTAVFVVVYALGVLTGIDLVIVLSALRKLTN